MNKQVEALAEQPAWQQELSDGWLQNYDLLYRLTEGPRPYNRDEIKVRMVDGSFSKEARCRRAGELLDRLRAPQPAQQEPVAWMHTMIDDVVIGHRPADIARHPDRWTPLYTAPSPCPRPMALARTVMMDQTAHDTPPAQRTWVGLSEQEAAECWSTSTVRTWQAIEAKLKEKNT